MPDLNPAAPVARPTPSSPLGATRAVRTGPMTLPEPRMPGSDRNKVAATEDPLDKTPRGVDLTALARTAGQLGQALQNATDLVDAGASTADAVAFAPDAIQQAFGRLGKAPADAGESLAKAVDHATKAGRVLGAVGAAIAAKDLFDSVWPELDVAAAGEALSNLALGLATVSDELFAAAGTNALVRSVGGIAGMASSLFCLAREIKDAKANGIAFGNVAGMIAAGVTAGGSAMLLIPGTEAIGGALIMAGASLNLVKLAHENWDGIKGRASSITGRVGGWLGMASQPTTGPPGVVIPPKPATA